MCKREEVDNNELDLGEQNKKITHKKKKKVPAGYLRLAVPFAVAIKGVFLSYLLCLFVCSRSKYALASYLLPKSQSDVSALTHFYHQFKVRKQARIHIYIS